MITTRKTTSNNKIIVWLYLGKQKKKASMEIQILKKFWITELSGHPLSLFFSLNPLQVKKIILLENEEAFANDSSVAKVFLT